MESLLSKVLAMSVFAVGRAGVGDFAADVFVDFSGGSAVASYKTTATLQVVENPLLDRTFIVDGVEIPNPIHDAAWKSLKDLGADYVRFQPWFPYPHKAVAELDAPVPGKPTSWNFTAMMPQLEDFMANTAAEGHPVIWNFGTVPCWMFWGPTTNHSHCPYPKDPEALDFGYGARGFRPFFFKDPSGKMLAEYYARLLSFLINGYMFDENGVLHKGGPAYNFSASAGHIFEFLNEGEHQYTASEYVNDYDATVPALQNALGDRMPNIMGIGGCHDGHWNWWFMGNCTTWLNEYLDRSKHKASNIPLDYASIHYYATSSNRSDVDGYAKNFFGSADKWLPFLEEHVAQRDRLSPNTKLALTELGILMVDDMSQNFGSDGGLPDLYFNAAAAFLAYVYTHVAKKGIDIACFSQFVGNPPIEKWGIKDMNFPSGSMISWETGLGNAKYWVLKLFIDHVKKGDLIVDTNIWFREVDDAVAPQKVMCEAVGPWTFNNEITLTCADPKARIDRIWADMGLQPQGECGEYRPNTNCSNSWLATAWAASHCFGRRSCTLNKESQIAEMAVCPLQTVVRNDVNLFSQRLTVQASCTGDKGGVTSSEYEGDSIFTQAFVSPDRKTKKLLIVNKLNRVVTMKVSAAELDSGSATAYIVDGNSVTRSSANGIRQEVWKPQVERSSVTVELQPFAVVMAVMDEGVPSAEGKPILI